MGGPLTTAVAWARAALLAPVSRRARNELLFCLAGVPLGLCLLVVVLWLMAVALMVVVLSPPSRSPSVWVGVAALALDVLGVGLAVRAWGVSDREVLRDAIKAGIDGVTCNWPDWSLQPTR